MPLSDLLGETLETPDSDCWDRERTATWLRRFVHYYNTQRPHQALNGRMPAEEA